MQLPCVTYRQGGEENRVREVGRGHVVKEQQRARRIQRWDVVEEEIVMID